MSYWDEWIYFPVGSNKNVSKQTDLRPRLVSNSLLSRRLTRDTFFRDFVGSLYNKVARPHSHLICHRPFQ